MIEETVIRYLAAALPVAVYPELPHPLPERFVVVHKGGTTRAERLETSIFTVNSYAESRLQTAVLNEQVKEAMDSLPELDEVSAAHLSVDHPFYDEINKRRRYQAVYDITHY